MFMIIGEGVLQSFHLDLLKNSINRKVRQRIRKNETTI
ncbi:hypothetical protein EC33884_A0220 [Escherichia coli 3.3884]|nr:hypothetical protein EC33884_A0220 [Escherichia coli 3.3884]